MPWAKPRRNWKAQHPTRLEDAFHLCKEYARERQRLSVERLADLMAVKPSLLYKWMEEGSMPTNRIAQFEHFCGANFVSRFLAGSGNKVVVDIPAGHPADAESLNGLQSCVTDAIGKLIRLWKGEADIEETVAALTVSLQAIAWHRENAQRSEQPELGLGGEL